MKIQNWFYANVHTLRMMKRFYELNCSVTLYSENKHGAYPNVLGTGVLGFSGNQRLGSRYWYTCILYMCLGSQCCDGMSCGERER